MGTTGGFWCWIWVCALVREEEAYTLESMTVSIFRESEAIIRVLNMEQGGQTTRLESFSNQS